MKYKFNVTLNRDDYISLEEEREFQRGASFGDRFLIILWIFWGFIEIYLHKDFYPLLMALCVCFAVMYLQRFGKKRFITKRVDRLLKKDTSYLSPREFTFSMQDLEIKALPKENESMIICVYPYSVFSTIVERGHFFEFVLTSEAFVIPKKAIPEEYKGSVIELIRRQGNYYNMKNI